MVIKELSRYVDIRDICKSQSFYPLFRGTKKDVLLPSLITTKFSTPLDYEQKEKEMASLFSQQYPTIIQEENDTQRDWEYRIIAREHGLWNRLMDWSNNFINALDFATSQPEKVEDQFVYLWLFNYPYEIIERPKLRLYDFSKINNTFFFHGIISANGGIRRLDQHRQFIQGGYFFVQPSSEIMTPINSQQGFSNNLIQIKMPAALISDIRKEMIEQEDNIDFTKSIMYSTTDPVDDYCCRLNKEHLSVSKNKA